MASEFIITNLDDVVNKLGRSVEKTRTAAQYALAQVAFKLEREAKQNFQGKQRQNGMTKGGNPRWKPGYHTPEGARGDYPNVRTGNLRQSIRANVSGLNGWTAQVGVGMVYARQVEKYHPFLEPAVRRVRPIANQLFAQAFARGLA